ncbi:hypothetical protein Glove_23g77 [Diversispora epigaea]|uniref:Serine-threonine/tyrosine-protein kinase catalytic domain-containing protein n=1 Tax=Diversispora epigaea TaxID=1348612 RepID=A0A397JJ83_9GLOM|nr:hypothetical protein Glove_23g77 [Diversispora epigaea]
MESLSNVDLLNDIVKGKREMDIPGTPPKYKEIYIDCWKHNRNSRPNISQVVENLSEIIISDAIVEFETHRSQPYNVANEIISVKLEKPNIQKKVLEVHPDPPFVDKSAEAEVFIKDLFEFFSDIIEKQVEHSQSIMMKNYIEEHKKNPVEVLCEMISHLSHSWFTSLIGFFYKNGIGTITDNKMAFKFFSIAANEIIDTSSSNPSSLMKLYNKNKEIGTTFLADMHLEGIGIEKDEKKAYQIYSKLANEGSVIALIGVAGFYIKGSCVEKNEEKAFELCLKSAEKGIILAQCIVGLLYEHGLGTPKDAAKEFQWYMKAALAGNIIAICRAGHCYKNGIGVGKDEKEAFKLYSKAAEQGNLEAQFSLGNLYENGYGMNKDQAKAFEWYKKAAECDYIDAQYKVGKFFYEGCGIKKDIVKAIYWLNKAKENKNKKATKLLEEIINKIK